jgi:CO/xanthine dehydrogenase Mo-binding subunit
MYTSNKVLCNAAFTCTGPYRIPNARVSACSVYTNNLPGGAFRGFGAPQGLFSAESQMNRLAEALGVSPVELRMKNLLEDGDLLSVGTPLPGPVSLKQVTQAAARAGGWLDSPAGDARRVAPATGRNGPARGGKRKGRGIAAGLKNVGFSFGYQENSWAKVVLEGKEEIVGATLFIGGADVGQGHHTVMAQIAAEALGLPLERIKLVASDSALTESSGSASASRLTYMAGNAVKGAAERALVKWQDEERPAVAEYTYLAPKTEALPHDPGHTFKPNVAYGYVAQSVDLEVDTETGFIHIDRVVSAHEVGKAINPQLVTGQIEGGIVQAEGYALLENFQTRDGYVLTPTMSTYLIPGVLDIPDRIEMVIVETPDPDGPYGVRGVAEMPYLGIAPAILAAVHDATGVWFSDFPLTPERVLRGLGKI